MLLACETNTNACVGEVTLDFHTDRFSFFFSLMRFQERAREGGWWNIIMEPVIAYIAF